MSILQHPAELNPLQQYRQASNLLKTTSRAKNPAWYQNPLDLDFQLHLRSDGAGVSVFLYDRKQNLWAPGPRLTEQQLLDPAAITAYTIAAVEHTRSAGGTSLGIVLHVADEFSLTEIKPDLQDRDSLPELRELTIHEPATILADSIQADQSSWRLIPYFSPESHSLATAVTISRRYASSLAALRAMGESEDFPIITTALSAPLVALMGIHGNVTRSPGRPAVSILQYPAFTVIAFFDGNTDLLLLRTQLHRGLQRPPNFRHTISTALASLELDAPDIFVFSLGREVDRALLVDLPSVFPDSHIEAVPTPGAGVIPPWCAECLISTETEDNTANTTSTTMRALREDRWSLQDFLPPSKESAEIFPTKQEISLLRILKYVRTIAACTAILLIGWLVYGIFEISRSPEWVFEPSEGDAVKNRLIALNMEQANAEHWNAMLEDRSKGWTVMESLARMFPENSGILIQGFDYSARPETIAGQSRLAMVRDWKINGLVKDEGLELLNTLNSREGISARFNEIAEATGHQSFRADLNTRSLLVSIRTQENGAFKQSTPPPSAVRANTAAIAVDESYQSTFNLEITQRFEATDPSAVLAAAAP